MRNRRAFTLVELLVVVFILAAIAASASTLVDGAHDQARFDDNAVRLSMLRRAVAGSDDPSAAISGYMADVGKLPSSLRDLLRRPPAVLAYTTSHTTHTTTPPTAALTGVGSGWRGPYLRASQRSDGNAEFADGWGNSDDPTPPILDEVPGDPNFGWLWTITDLDLATESLKITSFGPNGVDDTTLPPASLQDDVAEVLSRNDHHVDLSGHVTEVTVYSSSGSPSQTLRLQVWIPDGSGGVISVPSMTTVMPLLAAGEDAIVSFSFPAGAQIPHGVRAFEVLYEDTSPQFVPFSTRQYALVELRARASLPTRVARRFDVTPP